MLVVVVLLNGTDQVLNSVSGHQLEPGVTGLPASEAGI